jgi:SHS family lactate transporter-like MFS transporter
LGRKWPFIINIILYALIEMATRGLLFGLLQQGFACGYLLAAAFNLAITDDQRYGWRALFWFGDCSQLFIAL